MTSEIVAARRLPFDQYSPYSSYMSPEAVSYRWLSLRCWLTRTVFPAAAALLAVLILLQLIGPDTKTLDHTAVLVGFSALYFILFRGGHILMMKGGGARPLSTPTAESFTLVAVPAGAGKALFAGLVLAAIPALVD